MIFKTEVGRGRGSFIRLWRLWGPEEDPPRIEILQHLGNFDID